MKKFFFALSSSILIVSVVTILSVQAAPAPVNSSTCPVPPTLGTCADSSLPDYYNGTCRVHITSCPSGQVFSCASGCYTPPTCASGQIDTDGTSAGCKNIVQTINDTVLKVWTGSVATLKRLVYVDDTVCADQQVIKWDAATGSWVCAADNGGGSSQWTTSGSSIYYDTGTDGGVAIGDVITGVGAGYKLDIFGNVRVSGNFEVANSDSTVTLPLGTINSTEIANNTIVGGAATGTGDIATNTITSWNVLDNTLTALDIAASAITSDELANDAVTSAKIADDVIWGSHIADGTISTADIYDGDVKLADLDNSSVNSDKIVNRSIMSTDIANDAITSSLIFDNTITSSDIADDAITSAEINNQTITSADIGENQVKSSELAMYFADLGLSPVTTVLPGEYNTASSFCNGSDVAISGECEAFTTAEASSRSNAIYITGSYRTNDVVGSTTVYNRTWNCRGYNSVGSNRYLRARAVCLESN